MHQDAANGYMTKTSIPAAPHTCTGNQPEVARALSLVGELCRVVQDQGRAGSRMKPRTRGLKMSAENVGFAYARIGKKAVSRFRAGPILAGKRNAASDAVGYLFNQRFESPAQAHIAKVTSSCLQINPSWIRGGFKTGLYFGRWFSMLLGSHPKLCSRIVLHCTDNSSACALFPGTTCG